MQNCSSYRAEEKVLRLTTKGGRHVKIFSLGDGCLEQVGLGLTVIQVVNSITP